MSARTFALTAKPADGKPVESRVAHAIDLVTGGNNQYYYRITADRLAVAVAEEAPFKIRLVEPKGPIAQGGAMNLKVVAERKPEFKGYVSSHRIGHFRIARTGDTTFKG